MYPEHLGKKFAKGGFDGENANKTSKESTSRSGKLLNVPSIPIRVRKIRLFCLKISF